MKGEVSAKKYHNLFSVLNKAISIFFVVRVGRIRVHLN